MFREFDLRPEGLIGVIHLTEKRQKGFPGRGNSVCKGRDAQRIEIIQLLSLGNSRDAAGKLNCCQPLQSLECHTRMLYFILSER